MSDALFFVLIGFFWGFCLGAVLMRIHFKGIIKEIEEWSEKDE